MRSGQVLDAVDVDLLLLAGGQDAQQPGGASLAGHLDVEPHLGHPRADLRVEGGDVGVLADHHPLRADVPRAVAEPLQVRVADPRSLPGADLDDPAEPAGAAVGRDDLLEQRDAAVALGDHQAEGVVRDLRSSERAARHERAIDLDSGGHVQEQASGPGRLRQRPEMGVRTRALGLPRDSAGRGRDAPVRRSAGP